MATVEVIVSPFTRRKRTKFTRKEIQNDSKVPRL
jgi:hypothetical protein